MAVDTIIKTEKLCKYKDKTGFRSDYQCHEKPLSDSKQSFCIFHEPGKTEKDCNQFEAEINDKLRNNIYDFTGYVFPKIRFFNTEKFTDAEFVGATFKENVFFTGPHFNCDACFMGSTFEGNANFIGLIFTLNLFLVGSTFKKEANFRESTVEMEADFIEATFNGRTDFIKTSFKRMVNFNGSTFRKEAFFEKSTFREEAKFIGITFGERADFSESKFKDDVNFTKSKFEKRAFFSKSIFKGEIHAKDTKLESKYDSVIFFRLAKNAAYTHGNYVDQGYYHQKEMDQIRKGQVWYKRGWNFIIQKLLHGYGEKPINVFITALIVILISSLFFSIFGIHE